MLDRILDRNDLATSVSLVDLLPVVADPMPILPTMFPAPKMNGAVELKINRDGLDLKVAFSLDLGR